MVSVLERWRHGSIRSANYITKQSHPKASRSSSPDGRIERVPIPPCSCSFLVFNRSDPPPLVFNRSDPLRTLAAATPFVCTRTILYIVKPPPFTDKTRLPDALHNAPHHLSRQ